MEKLSLKDREWKEFVFEDIFNFEKGTKESLSKEVYENGYFDYVGATSRNNGTVGFVNKKYKKYIKKGNSVVFINTGEGSVGDAVYKTNDFIPSNNVTLGRADFLNKYVGLFIITIVNNQSFKYNYGYIRNENRLKRDKFLLPITSKSEPDYAFMENYMKQKETELLKQYEKQVSDFESVVPLSEKEWKEFKITDIFNYIQRGKRLKKEDHKSGVMPYVSSTGINNGVDGFVGNKENVRIFSNCLTLANSGSVGATFYQPFSFVASDHITKLENNNFNTHIYLFIANMMSRFSEKYSFNREINDTRIKKEKILLPTNSKNEPDYAYMENYMKSLESNKITQYLEYLKK